MDEDRNAILELHHAWIEAELSGDYSRMLAMCSDDIKLVPPESVPVEGKAAVGVMLQGGTHEVEKVKTFELQIEVSGSLAYKTCSFAAFERTTNESDEMMYQGHSLWILRKENGKWRILIVSWSIIS
jgi:ketosteroid isomerase-like protein